MTECSPVISLCDINDSIEKKAQTVGRVAPMSEVQIVDPTTGKLLPWG